MNDTPQFVLGADAGTHGIRILAMRLPDCHIAAKSAAQYHRVLANGIQELHAEALTGARSARLWTNWCFRRMRRSKRSA